MSSHVRSFIDGAILKKIFAVIFALPNKPFWAFEWRAAYLRLFSPICVKKALPRAKRWLGLIELGRGCRGVNKMCFSQFIFQFILKMRFLIIFAPFFDLRDLAQMHQQRREEEGMIAQYVFCAKQWREYSSRFTITEIRPLIFVMIFKYNLF